MRLDKTLAEIFPSHPRTAWQRLIGDGAIVVNGEECRRTSRRVARGDDIVANIAMLPQIHLDECDAEDLPIQIVYEDADIIVINKAAGMVSHPGHGNRNGTLQSALLFHHPPTAALPRAGIVHRLDKETSGLLVAAKTEKARQSLIAQFKARTVRREYLALVHGKPAATGVINRPLASKRHVAGKMAVVHEGKEAITRYAVLQGWSGFSLLRCWLETGRTHQIRVHLEYAGHPIVGDSMYSLRARPLPFEMPRQALHAEVLRLIHPKSGEEKQWRIELPTDFQNVLQYLEEHPVPVHN